LKLWILFVLIWDEGFLVQLLKVPAFYNDILYLISFTLFLCFLATAFVVLSLNLISISASGKNNIFNQCENLTLLACQIFLCLLVRGPMPVLYIDVSLFTPCKWLVFRPHLCLCSNKVRLTFKIGCRHIAWEIQNHVCCV
jgi:hypothetical protein